MMATLGRSRAVGCASKNLISKSCCQYSRALVSLEIVVLPTEAGPVLGRKKNIEKLWREFFSNPSEWWDHRSDKVNPKYPDFKHKKTNDGLWIIDKCNPPWVRAELAAIAPGTLQLNIYAWNKALERYAKAGEYEKTFDLFQQMQREGINPDKVTFIRVLNACSSAGALEQGRKIHLQIIQAGHESDVFVGSCLVDMYAKCGSIRDAWRVFAKMPTRNVVSWTAMLLACVKYGQGKKALKLFRHMHKECLELDPLTYVGVLNACAREAALEEGKQAHEQIVQRGFESNVFVCNSLIDMYGKCGSVENAWSVFSKMPMQTVVSWSAMILAYVKSGEGTKALDLFRQMCGQGVEPNSSTFVAVLNACASVVALEEGRRVHEMIIQGAYEADIFVGSSLVDMYAKCGSINDALRVFTNMPVRNVVSWTAIILGYVRCGQGQEALDLFQRMLMEGVEPNYVTFVGVLNACASLSALEEGRRVHELIIQKGYESEVLVGNGLVDMYAKCGTIEGAWRVFDKMPTRDVVSWNAMLGAFSIHGHAEEALLHFEKMHQEGIKMNRVTFVSLLSACSHAGFVDEGLCFFESMSTNHSISPIVDHYTCMVDLLGRAGRLHEAKDLIKKVMSFEADACMWMSLLSCCRLHGNVEMGECVAQQVQELEPRNVESHVLLSNIYSAACSNESAKQERLGPDMHRMLGCSWNEVLVRCISHGV